MHVTPAEIPLVAQLVKELCGVVLDQSKAYLIESRLSPIAAQFGCTSFSQVCRLVRAGNRQLAHRIVDAITTQETLFFRDGSPFEALQHRVLPDLIDARTGPAQPGTGRQNSRRSHRIRIWSAGCSTGQEPYSIGMAILETLPHVPSWDIHILATDISDEAIARASRGRYAACEIQRGMKAGMLEKYFFRDGETWTVRDELRALVAFQKRNLHDPFVGLGPFDVIFCRNVAIYFDAESRKRLFFRIADCLTPDGWLFVGASESLLDLGPRFAPHHHCRSVFYRPNLAPTPPGAAAPGAATAAAAATGWPVSPVA